MKYFATIVLCMLACLATFSQTGIVAEPVSKKFSVFADSMNSKFEGTPAKGAHKRWKRAEYQFQQHLNINGALDNYIHNNFEAVENLRLLGVAATGDWEFVGPFNTEDDFLLSHNEGIGRVNCVAFIDEDSWLVGTAGGGLWKTDVGGVYIPEVPFFSEPWIPLTDNIPVLSISGVVVHPADPDIIYILTGDGDHTVNQDRTKFGIYPAVPSIGILKTVDGGATWDTTALVYDRNELVSAHKILMRPGNPNTMYAATSSGLYVTYDGWATIADHYLTGSNVYDIEIHPTNPNIIYISSSVSIFKSIDGLDTPPSDITIKIPGYAGALRIALAVTASAPNNLYVLRVNSDRGLEGIYTSFNKGVSFSTTLDGHDLNILAPDGEEDVFESGQGEYDLAFTVDPENANKIFVGGIGMWASSTGGLTWSHLCDEDVIPHDGAFPVPNYVHADIHTIEFNPFGDNIICGTDGGLFSSPGDNDYAWEKKCFGLGVSQFYHFDVNDSWLLQGEIIAGAQDNNVVTGPSFGPSTFNHQIIGGDGFNVFSGYFDGELYQYSEVQNGKIYFHAIDGPYAGYIEITPEQGIDPEDSDNYLGSWDTPIEINHNSFDEIVAGYNKLYWANDFDLLFDTDWNELWDGGAGAYDSEGRILEIAWNKNNSDEMAFFAFDAANDVSHLYFTNLMHLMLFTEDEYWDGVSINLMTGIEGDVAISDIQYAPYDTTNNLVITIPHYYEGKKVFRYQDTSWVNISYDLPNVPALCAYDDDNGLYVGTDIGVFYLYDGDSTWIYHSEGLPTVPVTQIEVVENISGKFVYACTYGRGIWVGAPAPPNRTTRYYVDHDAVGTDNGTSWTNAFHNVQQALDFSLPGDTIWVAEGTYYPTFTYPMTGGTPSRTYTFIVGNNVVLYGGFNGTESSADERNPELYPTILSGDLGTIGTSTDNSYHVLTILNSTKNSIIDGFTISDGRSDGSSPYPSIRVGGAVRLAFDSLFAGRPTFKDCIFKNNFAYERGGAVLLQQYFDSDFQTYFVDCAFNNNSCGTSGRGGAIFLDASAGVSGPYGDIDLFMDGCSFDANSAGTGNGSAIYNDAQYSGQIVYTISNTTFTNNKNNSAGGYGGAIYNTAESNGFLQLTLDSCVFIDNDASAGGSVYNYSQTAANTIDLIISGCQFDSSSGYAVYATAGNINLDIDLSSFHANTGGIIHVGTGADLISTGSITNCTFTNNSTSLYLDASNSYTTGANKYIDYEIINCSFTNGTNSAIKCSNYSAGLGDYHAEYTLDNCSFLNNTGDKGGAIYNATSPGFITATINNCNFTDNTASSFGGAIYTSGAGKSFVEIDSCIFESNYATDDGGAVYNTQVIGNTITNSLFNGNAADLGGAVYQHSSTYSIPTYNAYSNCQFTNNTATEDGAALDFSTDGVAEVTTTIDSCSFEDNIATQSAGAIYFYNIDGDNNITLLNSSFVNNTSSSVSFDGGGAIQVRSSSEADTLNLDIQNCLFDDNNSNKLGGAIYFNSSGIIQADFYKVDFTSNSATSRGGAFFGETSSGDKIEVSFDSCNFYLNNSNVHGGAISFHDGASNGAVNLTMSNCILSENSAATAGAVSLYNESSTEVIYADFTSCLFNDNFSSASSGAIYFGANGDIQGTANDCRFINNTAVTNGGAVRMYAYSTDLIGFEFMNCLFDGNVAADLGGSAYIQTDQSGTISSQFNNCVLVNGEADRGGAIYATATNAGAIINIPITNCTVANNHGTIETGGVYITRTSTPAVDGDMINTILWNNTDVAATLNKKQAYISGGATSSLINSIVMDAIPAGTIDVAGNLISDPLFIDDADTDGEDEVFATSDDGFSIQTGSPAINNGTVVTLTTDITGLERPQEGFYDIGAYEYGLSCIEPEIPVLDGDSIICNGETTTLNIISGDLNSAADWNWYSSSCGGTSVGSGTSIVVSPTSTTTYYTRGEGGCVEPGSCASITVTVNSIPANVSGLKANLITACNIKYKWNAVVGAINYSLEYKLNSSPTWLSAGTVTVTNKNITGLTAGTSYDVRVRANNAIGCAGNWVQKLNTVTYLYDIPTNPSESLLASTSVTLNWMAPACGSVPVTYQLQYKLSTSPTWTTIPGIAGLNYALTGLTASTTYNWKVRANYAGGNSAYTKGRTFTTLPLRFGDEENFVSIYPNPNEGIFTLQLKDITLNDELISVFNDLGEIVFETKANGHEIEIDLGDHPAGIYLIKLIINGQVSGYRVAIQ